MFSFPPGLQGHTGPRGPALKRNGIAKNTFYVGNMRRPASLIESKAIQVEADDRVVVPPAAQSECLVEEVSLG